MTSKRARVLPHNAKVVILGLAGVVLLAIAVSAYVQHRRAQGIDAFVERYAAANDAGRELISEEFLQRYSASELLTAVEQKFSYRTCHTQGHPIGRAIYKQTQNLSESIRQCAGYCTYGCFHGVLMELFNTDSDTFGGTFDQSTSTDYLAGIRAAAKNLCTQPQVLDVVRSHTCYHGLGHVFQSVSGDTDAALHACSVWPDSPRRQACAGGVFMELLFASSTLLNTKTDAPCDKYPWYSTACFDYKAPGWLNAWGGDPHSAMRACDSFGWDAVACVGSVAKAQATRVHVDSDDQIDALCGGLDGDKHEACIDGVLRQLADFNNGNDGPRACDRVGLKYRARCVSNMQVFDMLFGD